MKITMPTASNKRYNHHFQFPHLTTFDFAQIRPISVIPCIAGDKVKVNYRQTTLMSPLAVPTYGSFDLKFSSYFVPTTSIWHRYEDYRREGRDSSIASNPPSIDLLTFFETIFSGDGVFSPYDCSVYYDSQQYNVYGFIDNLDPDSSTLKEYATLGIVDEDSSDPFAHDFVFAGRVSGENDFYYWYLDLTIKGRNLLNIFEGLGYAIPRVLTFSTMTASQVCYSYLNSPSDASPLLSFFRVLYDYVYPSEYLDALGVGKYFGEDVSVLQVDDINKLFELVFNAYKHDFWTSLFVGPNSSTSSSPVGAQSLTTLEANLQIGQSSNTNYVQQNSPAISTTMTSNVLRWLESASDYVLRNNLAGSRFADWMRAHFGFVTSQENKNISKFIKSSSDTVVIRAVQNQSESSQMLLGELAGQGSSQGGSGFSYDCKEDGFIIILATLVPQIGYVFGNAPWTIYPTDQKDLYTPEFDSLGYEGVPRQLLFSRYGLRSFDGITPMEKSGLPISSSMIDANSIFGYAPRYSYRYRFMPDMMTGDFALNSRNSVLGSYHTFRDLTPYALAGTLNNNLNFKLIDTDFDRVFAVPSNDERNFVDHFITLFNFDVRKSSFVKSASDSLPFFDKSGKDEVFDFMGNK